MVGEAKQQYAKFDLAGEAKHQGLKNTLQLITVASLVQAEGKTDDDFRKMAKVVYNRLVPTNKETYGQLQFDSTYNYIKNEQRDESQRERAAQPSTTRTTRTTTRACRRDRSATPGLDALKAAMNPDPGDWYYFISLDGKTTQFTKTHAEFEKLKKNYHPQSGSGRTSLSWTPRHDTRARAAPPCSAHPSRTRSRPCCTGPRTRRWGSTAGGTTGSRSTRPRCGLRRGPRPGRVGGALADDAAQAGRDPAARRDLGHRGLGGSRQHRGVRRRRPPPGRQHRHPGHARGAGRAGRHLGAVRGDPRRRCHRVLRAGRAGPDLRGRGHRLRTRPGARRPDAAVGRAARRPGTRRGLEPTPPRRWTSRW